MRKAAHAMDNAAQGMPFVGAVYQAGERRKNALFLSWGIGTGYAATDEIHQLFVPGRSGQLSDVLLDSAGVMAGIIIVLLLIRMVNLRINRKLSASVNLF